MSQATSRGGSRYAAIIWPSNSYLHAAESVIALAGTPYGVGCLALLLERANFTTAELKPNFLGTARAETISCSARAVHTSRTTHVWDAEGRNDETGKAIILFAARN